MYRVDVLFQARRLDHTVAALVRTRDLLAMHVPNVLIDFAEGLEHGWAIGVIALVGFRAVAAAQSLVLFQMTRHGLLMAIFAFRLDAVMHDFDMLKQIRRFEILTAILVWAFQLSYVRQITRYSCQGFCHFQVSLDFLVEILLQLGVCRLCVLLNNGSGRCFLQDIFDF